MQSLQFRGKIKRKACMWLDDVKERTGLSSNEMWREHAEDREACICHAIFKKIVLARITHLESRRLHIFELGFSFLLSCMPFFG